MKIKVFIMILIVSIITGCSNNTLNPFDLQKGIISPADAITNMENSASSSRNNLGNSINYYGYISGKAVDSTNGPINGATITAEWHPFYGNYSTSTVSTSNGAYNIKVNLSSHYNDYATGFYISVSKTGYGSIYYSNKLEISVKKDQTTSSINFLLYRTGEATKPDIQFVSLSYPPVVYETVSNTAILVISNTGTPIITSFKVRLMARYNNTDVYSYYIANWYEKTYPAILGTNTVVGLGQNESKTINIPLIAPLGPPVYNQDPIFVGVQLDYDNAVSESDEANNKTEGSTRTIRIRQYGPDIAPLTFKPQSNFTFGQSYTIPVSITNMGAADTMYSFNVRIMARYNNPDVYSYYIANWYGKTYPAILGTYAVTGIAAGEVKSFNIPITIPTGGTSGVNYIGIQVDSDNTITEMNTEWGGEGNWNKGGWNGTSYSIGDFLKQINISTN